MTDPTYVRSEIASKPEWELAFTLSEIMNAGAPIGWGKYIFAAKCLLDRHDIKRKSDDNATPQSYEAGAEHPQPDASDLEQRVKDILWEYDDETVKQILTALAEAHRAEREQCAEIAESYGDVEIADAIRALGGS